MKEPVTTPFETEHACSETAAPEIVQPVSPWLNLTPPDFTFTTVLTGPEGGVRVIVGWSTVNEEEAVSPVLPVTVTV